MIGGALNVATHWGQIKDFGDGLAAFGIGAAAGALTAATGGAAAGGMGLGLASVGGGAVSGAVGAIVGSPVQGIGNSLYFGDQYSVKQLGFDVLAGGILGGAAGGIANYIQGLKGNPTNLWNGKVLGPGRTRFSFFSGSGEVGVGDVIYKMPNGRVVDGRTGEILFEDPMLAGAQELDEGMQGKHLLGHNNFNPSRSPLTADANTLMQDVKAGNFELIQTGGRGPIIKFDRMVGDVIDRTGISSGPTPYVKVHIKANGLTHFVPFMPLP